MRPSLGTTWLVAVGVLLVGCAKERALPGTDSCESWEDDVQTVVVGNCATTGCHAGAQPAASYDLGSYGGLFGKGTDDERNVIAGDASSKLLAVLTPDDATHASLASLRPALERWIVQCQAPYSDTPIHTAGLLNPSADDFHGKLIAESDWDLDACGKCHDAEDDSGNPLHTFTGGKSGVSCRSCHVDDATETAWPQCGTCHEATPTTGAHVRHRTPGPLDRSFDCTTCHTIPTAWDAPGHVKGDTTPGHADVVMSGFAVDANAMAPSYDPATKTCSNVYCHGGTLGDASAAHAQPVWDLAIPDQAKCGGCHGLAPAPPHSPNARCASCHQRVVAQNGTLNTTTHLDGEVEVGKDETPTCTSCHGGAGGAVPPPDVTGSSSTSSPGVGAHASHLTAPSGISGRFQCTDCHVVPDALDSPGHIDSDEPGDVFPMGLGGLAFADSAVPMYDAATRTCTGAYCHGGGQKLANDTRAFDKTPRWTDVGGSANVCGACHGIPPVDGVHQSDWTILFCVTCHSKTIDAEGHILRTGAPGAETSEHIDGNVDFNQ